MRRGRLKKSLSVSGHRTSIALEAEFWDALQALAERQNETLPALVARIDRERQNSHPLSSALRLAALRYYRDQLKKSGT